AAAAFGIRGPAVVPVPAAAVFVALGCSFLKVSRAWVLVGTARYAPRSRLRLSMLCPLGEDLFEQFSRTRLFCDLVKRAVFGAFVGSPAQEGRAVPEAPARHVIVAHLHDQLRLQRHPFAASLRRPAARAARRIAAKPAATAQTRKLFLERR